MAKYDSYKNAELQALLKQRGLATTGKKADLIARLNEDDAKNAAAEPAKPAAATNDEDEIDWDDDDQAAAPAPEKAAEPAPAASEPAPTPAAETVAKAGGEGQAPNPQAVPNQIADIDPSTTDDLAVKAPEAESTDAAAESAVPAQEEEKKEEVPPPDYTKGLAATNLDEEIEKRKKRAAKFGLKIEDDEGLKKLERMKKFGETGPPKGLDDALPDRPLKRGREGNDQGRRGGDKRGRNDRNNDRNGRRGGQRQNQGEKRRDDRDREPRAKGGNGNGTSWMSEADQKKAEERRKKWATPA